MNQNDEFLKLYGEIMFRIHLIEDILIIHLLFCSQFHLNGYGKSPDGIRRLSLKEAIDELEIVYRDSPKIEKLVTPLNCVRNIRNKLTHHFVSQVGNDLKTEAGRDQINGMLSEIAKMARVYLRVLQENHEEVFKLALKNDFTGILREEFDPEPSRNVSMSAIQKEIDNFKISLDFK